MRQKSKIALAVAAMGAGLLSPIAAQPAQAAPAAGWTEVAQYGYYDDCEVAGLRGQNKRWWVTYRCMVSLPSKPGKPGVYHLDVKYN
ncbi:hypothetical protein [Actinoplanes philippinensis]|uniref:hypothetical protein n=1 Tax=Actinoplanes philippinensis TaxID=35752 RepID=UPI0033EB4468